MSLLIHPRPIDGWCWSSKERPQIGRAIYFVLDTDLDTDYNKTTQKNKWIGYLNKDQTEWNFVSKNGQTFGNKKITTEYYWSYIYKS